MKTVTTGEYAMIKTTSNLFENIIDETSKDNLISQLKMGVGAVAATTLTYITTKFLATKAMLAIFAPVIAKINAGVAVKAAAITTGMKIASFLVVFGAIVIFAFLSMALLVHKKTSNISNSNLLYAGATIFATYITLVLPVAMFVGFIAVLFGTTAVSMVSTIITGILAASIYYVV